MIKKLKEKNNQKKQCEEKERTPKRWNEVQWHQIQMQCCRQEIWFQQSKREQLSWNSS